MGRADRPWSYEVENAGVGADGVYALRVWSYYRTPDMPVTTAEKNAVHAVIFKGVPAGNGATAQPPLKTDGVTPSDSLFFENFFQNDYRAYVSSVASGSRQVMKTGKKEYKIGYNWNNQEYEKNSMFDLSAHCADVNCALCSDYDSVPVWKCVGIQELRWGSNS